MSMPKYRDRIVEEQVDGMLLLKLGEEEWKELGVVSGLDRKRILNKIEQLQERLLSKVEVEGGRIESAVHAGKTGRHRAISIETDVEGTNPMQHARYDI